MTETILQKLFEHNNWANFRIIEACSALSDEHLDAEPQSATKGSIRLTLAASDAWFRHLARASLHLEGASAVRGVRDEDVMERLTVWAELFPG